MRRGLWLPIVGALMLLSACQSPPTATPTSRATPPTLLPTPLAASASRVDVLNQAEAAFQRGDASTAAALYERVANTPPAANETPNVSAAIVDYADFRGAIALLAAGREDAARARLDDLQTRDASSPLARLGAQLWDQYGMTAQLRGACAQVQPQIVAQGASVFATLSAAGVSVDATSVCAVPNS